MSEFNFQLDMLCDRFEDDWLAGNRPSIAEFLASSDPSLRHELVVNLVPLDLEYRSKTGEVVRPSDYAYLGTDAMHIAASLMDEI